MLPRIWTAALAVILTAGAPGATPALEAPPTEEGGVAHDDFLNLSLQDLLDIAITTPSRSAESIEDAPGIVTLISRQEIEGWDARNLGEILNRVASAAFISANVLTDNQVVLRKQSLTPYDTHVLILLDGRPLRDPIASGLNNAVYAAFPVDAIESVEVVRGPGSVLSSLWASFFAISSYSPSGTRSKVTQYPHSTTNFFLSHNFF